MTQARRAPLIYVNVRDVAGNRERLVEATHRIKKIEYTDSLKQADKCTITVDNFDLSNWDDPVWSHGNFVQISWGYPGAMALSRELVITKVKGFADLTIEARAKSVLIDAVKKSRTFRNKTRTEVVATIAKEYGYDETTLLLDDTEQRYGHITQGGMSDAQFIRKLAHQSGFEFYVDQEGLHFHPIKLMQTPLREFIWFSDPGQGDVLSISVETDVTRRATEVTKKSRDPLTKKTETAKANNKTDKEREGLARALLYVSKDLKRGKVEFQAAETAYSRAERTFFDPNAKKTMSYKDKALDDSMQMTAERANRKPYLYTPEELQPNMCVGKPAYEAQNQFRKAQLGAVKITLSAIGDPSMLAKSVVKLSNVGKRLTGLYYVSEVKHVVEPGGYVMTLKMRSDGTGLIGKSDGIPDVNGEVSAAKKPPEADKPCVPAPTPAALAIRPPMSKEGRAPWLYKEPGALAPAAVKNAKGEVVATYYKEQPTYCTTNYAVGEKVVTLQAQKDLKAGRVASTYQVPEAEKQRVLAAAAADQAKKQRAAETAKRDAARAAKP